MYSTEIASYYCGLLIWRPKHVVLGLGGSCVPCLFPSPQRKAHGVHFTNCHFSLEGLQNPSFLSKPYFPYIFLHCLLVCHSQERGKGQLLPLKEAWEGLVNSNWYVWYTSQQKVTLTARSKESKEKIKLLWLVKI